MENLATQIGYTVIYGSFIITILSILYNVSEGFKPVGGITIRDKNGQNFFVPKRIYYEMSLAQGLNLSGGITEEKLQFLANNKPQKLIKETKEHNSDWMWSFNRAKSCYC